MSSFDDDPRTSSAVVEDDRKPWWAYNPELIEMCRRTLEEFDRGLDQREPKQLLHRRLRSRSLEGPRKCAEQLLS
jgi:hypothetical protein